MTTPAAVRMVGWRWAVYRRFWKASVMSQVVQPLLYMLGLGVGVGALVDRNAGSGAALGGSSYVAYVAPGLLVTTAMALAAAEGLWPVMGAMKWDRGYHAAAATPLSASDILASNALWVALRAAIGAGAVAAVLAMFDDTRSWGLLPSVAVAAFVGLGFFVPLAAWSVGIDRGSGGFAAIQRFIIQPLFLFGGAFYPIDALPAWAGWLVRGFPLWHGVVVARQFTTGDISWAAVMAHLAYIGSFVVIGFWVGLRRLAPRLYP